MSTTSSAQTDTVDQGSESTSTKTARLVSYLRDEAAEGEAYIKERVIEHLTHYNQSDYCYSRLLAQNNVHQVYAV